MHEDLIQMTTALRAHYAPDNRVGMLLDELVADLKSGAPREEVLADAEAVKAECLDPTATAYKVIDRIVEQL